MSVLVQNSEGFALDARGADRCIIGSESQTTPDVSALEKDRRYALWPPDRSTFIRGLLTLWTSGSVPVLLPRAPDESTQSSSLGRLSFSDALPEDLGTITFGADDVVCEIFTSGSTGSSQIFRKTARQLFSEALALKQLLGLSPEDTTLATTASHHLYGLLFGVVAPICTASRIVASPRNEPDVFHPDEIAALAATHDVTCLISVPAHLHALLQAPIQLPSVKTIVSSAAPLDPVVARQLEEKFGATVVDVLGSTETGGIATRRAARTRAWTPLPGVRVSVDENDRLLIRSPFLESPDSDERSDERARIHEDGTFEYLGRADDVIKVGGKRISLGEIEKLALEIPGVARCACLSRPVPSLRGEEILLVATPESLKKDDLRAALRRHLDPAFVPRKIRLVSSLPFDERGKLKRADLLELFTTPDAPRNLVEKTLHVPPQWSRFAGHFEGDPLLPALSQLTDFILPEIRRAFGGTSLASLKRVKWTHAIRPGAELNLRLEKKSGGVYFQLSEGPIVACSGTASLDQEGP